MRILASFQRYTGNLNFRMPLVGLQCVIVVFADLTHFFINDPISRALLLIQFHVLLLSCLYF